MTSPMQKTKAVLKGKNVVHQVVERYYPKTKAHPFGCKEDFLHIIDLIALDNGVVGIQVCGTDWMPHVRKILEEQADNTRVWLEQPGTRLQLWGWRKIKKKRGGKLMVWRPRIADVLLVNGELYLEERKEAA